MRNWVARTQTRRYGVAKSKKGVATPTPMPKDRCPIPRLRLLRASVSPPPLRAGRGGSIGCVRGSAAREAEEEHAKCTTLAEMEGREPGSEWSWPPKSSTGTVTVCTRAVLPCRQSTNRNPSTKGVVRPDHSGPQASDRNGREGRRVSTPVGSGPSHATPCRSPAHCSAMPGYALGRIPASHKPGEPWGAARGSLPPGGLGKALEASCLLSVHD